MNPRSWSRGAQIGAAISVFLLAAFAGWFFFIRPVSLATDAAVSRAGQVVAEAQAGAATDGIRIVTQTNERVREIHTITEGQSRVILSQPGAETPLDPSLHAAGIHALCLRASRERDPQCAAVLHPNGGSVGAGQADPTRSPAGE